MNDTTSTTHKILCNTCKVQPEPIPDSDPQEWGCPVCGVHDTTENILGEANQHIVEVTARHIQNKGREVAETSSFIQFSGKPVPYGVYRFVTDIEMAA
ncbi:MAG: hypothetical protein Q8S03_15145 [Brevundimonas sp.]|uniref:hypothetical protein n=1 Tax=Brevundimonas sp. TaxID=1871086 RepID=UPI0027326670|nr:hypothetical protein [Brevundimonas sp.]MDP3406024.1 hypothetical protein [Brevundimonas sp.]